MLSNSNKIIVLLSLATSLVAIAGCKKSSPQPSPLVQYTFVGSSHATFEQDRLYEGEFSHRDWDSTYTDEIDVEIDLNTDSIKFIFGARRNEAELGIESFSFAYSPDNKVYSVLLASHISQQFIMSEDSLYARTYSYVGYGPNKALSTIEFSGKR